MYIKNILVLSILGCISGFSAVALAEDVNMQGTNEVAPPTAPVKVPARGSTMSSVEASFGAPTQRAEPIGKPPITKWEYPNIVVYFEYDHVVHSVVR